jgi:hypothetical protein
MVRGFGFYAATSGCGGWPDARAARLRQDGQIVLNTARRDLNLTDND